MNLGSPRPSERACFTSIYKAFALALTLVIALSAAMADPALYFPAKSAIVALDPGHGGKDEGARGPTGLLEKSICLELARRLALQLETQYQVTLTRSDDYRVDLAQRAATANQADADVMISLHTGAGYVHSNQGITIYYHCSPSITPHQMPPSGHADHQRQWHRTQSRHQSASLALATALKQHLDQLDPRVECTIQKAPLVLLEGADMPAVLIEIGHITHPAAEAKLATPQYQEQLSNQIHQGIQYFLSHQRHIPNDSRTP